MLEDCGTVKFVDISHSIHSKQEFKLSYIDELIVGKLAGPESLRWRMRTSRFTNRNKNGCASFWRNRCKPAICPKRPQIARH